MLFTCLNHYKTYSTELQWNCAPSTMIVLPVPCLLSQLSWLHTLLCMIWTTRIVTYGMNTSKSFIKMFYLLFLQLCENVSIVISISPIYRSRIVQLRIHVDIVYTITAIAIAWDFFSSRYQGTLIITFKRSCSCHSIVEITPPCCRFNLYIDSLWLCEIMSEHQ